MYLFTIFIKSILYHHYARNRRSLLVITLAYGMLSLLRPIASISIIAILLNLFLNGRLTVFARMLLTGSLNSYFLLATALFFLESLSISTPVGFEFAGEETGTYEPLKNYRASQ